MVSCTTTSALAGVFVFPERNNGYHVRFAVRAAGRCPRAGRCPKGNPPKDTFQRGAAQGEARSKEALLSATQRYSMVRMKSLPSRTVFTVRPRFFAMFVTLSLDVAELTSTLNVSFGHWRSA